MPRFVWAEIPVLSNRRRGRPGRIWPAIHLVVVAMLAAAFWWQGHPLPAGVLGAVATGMATLRVLRPKVSSRLDQLIARVTHAVGFVASALVAAGLQLLVFTPVAVLARVP